MTSCQLYKWRVDDVMKITRKTHRKKFTGKKSQNALEKSHRNRSHKKKSHKKKSHMEKFQNICLSKIIYQNLKYKCMLKCTWKSKYMYMYAIDVITEKKSN